MPEPVLITSRTFNLPFDNVDTDQIYPGRYLTTTQRKGLGDLCFFDWRNDPASGKTELFRHFDPQAQSILVSGDNFGCGSSREHAAWALLDMGIQVVISSKFPDIFKSNAEKNGLLLVAVKSAVLDFLHCHDRHFVTINVTDRSLDVPGLGTVHFPLDEFTAYCLLNGIDALGYLLEREASIAKFEKSRDDRVLAE